MSAQLTICNACVKLMEKVSAVLHMDEKTPHIHATIISIVTGERRKTKQQQEGKKKYRKKNTA